MRPILRQLSLPLCLLLLAGTVSCSEADTPKETVRQQGEAFAQVAAQVSPAVVSIQVDKVVASGQGPGWAPFDDFFRRFGPRGQVPQQQPRERHQMGQGSGFIISGDGYLITNNHVVEGAENGSIVAVLNDGREFEAEVVGTDPNSDVAVLKIEAEELPSLQWGSSNTAAIGEWVLAVGNPFGLGHTVTAGIISAKGRTTGILGAEGYENFLQTDAAINPGNSGGPLVNMDGQVIGINTAIFSRTGGSMGIGFAIPSDMALPIYKQLRDTGSVTRGFLGVMIQDIDPDMADTLNLDNRDGILVASVQPDSPADKAGLESGDVILQLNGEAVRNVARFRNDIAMMSPGSEVDITIDRQGERKQLDVTIGTRDPDMVAGGGSSGGRIGLSLQPLEETILGELGIDGGVQVGAVEPDSPAARAGIQAGDIIVSIDRKQVEGLQQAGQLIKQVLEENRNLLMLVHDGRGAHYVVIKPKQ